MRPCWTTSSRLVPPGRTAFSLAVIKPPRVRTAGRRGLDAVRKGILTLYRGAAVRALLFRGSSPGQSARNALFASRFRSPTPPNSGIASRNNRSCLDHQDHRPIGCPRAMHDPPGNHKALPRLEVDRPILEVDDEVAIKHKKEFIVIIVLVPMIFALHHAQAYHRIIDLA